MLSIPLPFIVSGILIFLFVRLVQNRVRDGWFLLFIGACALQSALVGLRWSFDLDWARFVLPVLGACLPPIAWGAFAALRGRNVHLLNAAWPVVILLSRWLSPLAIDPLLIGEFLLYAVLIFRLDFPDGVLTRVRIGDEWTVTQARNGVAALLAFSAVVDTIVAFGMASGHGAIATSAVAAMMSIMLAGLAALFLARAGGTVPADVTEPVPQAASMPAANTEEDETILAAVDSLLEEGLYRDYDLTLQRLARRVRIPARKISEAINRRRRQTVTDLVNGYRVREAMRLLRETELPVTQVMLESGFQTKSNFNRAFMDIAGQTPSEYRRSISCQTADDRPKPPQ
jgi:AraC-like DNA-binding protein